MLRRTVFKMLIVSAVYFHTNADVIMPGYHSIQRCAVVSNLSQYPDIVLIAAYKPAMSSLTMERYIIEEDTCLRKGYKLCPFYIFWAEKNYVNSTGLSNIPFEEYINENDKIIQNSNEHLQPISMVTKSIDPYGGQVPDSDKSTNEYLEYQLIPASGGNGYTLHLASKTIHYSDGSDTVTRFPLIAPVRKDKVLNNRDALARVTLAQGCLHLKCPNNGMITAQLIDCRGCVVNKFSRIVQADKYYTIPCPGVRSGMYWLKVESEDMKYTLPLRML